MVLNVMFFKVRIDAGTESINWLAGLSAAAEDNQSKQFSDSEKVRERENTHTHTPWNMRGQIMSHARPLKITL